MTKITLAAILALSLALLTGCITRTPRPISETAGGTETESVTLDEATRLDASIEMGAGQLSIKGADISPDALRGTFVYEPADLRPDVVDDERDGTLFVTVRDLDGFEMSFREPTMRNEWDISLPTSLPVELAVRVGAGEGDIDLRGVAVESFALEQGAGDVTVDLSGQTADLMAQATLGAGDLTVKVPARAGVRLTGQQDGLGEFTAEGFSPDGGALTNDAYGEPGVPTIDLSVQRGLGAVTIIQVP